MSTLHYNVNGLPTALTSRLVGERKVRAIDIVRASPLVLVPPSRVALQVIRSSRNKVAVQPVRTYHVHKDDIRLAMRDAKPRRNRRTIVNIRGGNRDHQVRTGGEHDLGRVDIEIRRNAVGCEVDGRAEDRSRAGARGGSAR